jgi:TonB family protein
LAAAGAGSAASPRKPRLPPDGPVRPPAATIPWFWIVVGSLVLLGWCSNRETRTPPSTYSAPPVQFDMNMTSDADAAARPEFSVARFDQPVDVVVQPGADALAAKLRSGPGNGYRYLERLPTGDPLSALGRAFAADGSPWIQVRRNANGAEGFVLERLVVRAAEVRPAAEGPSFDCAVAAAWDERAICGDRDLAASDRELARVYRDLLSSDNSDGELRSSQQEWQRARRRCQTNLYPSACLADAYSRRLQELRNWRSSRGAAPQQQPFSQPEAIQPPRTRAPAPYRQPPAPEPPGYYNAPPAEPTYQEPATPKLLVPSSSIIRDGDYPADAARQGEQGSVTIQVTVSDRGRVLRCAIVQSSGSDSLDSRTCDLFRRRARYSPAVGAAGKPLAGTIEHRVAWRLGN